MGIEKERKKDTKKNIERFVIIFLIIALFLIISFSNKSFFFNTYRKIAGKNFDYKGLHFQEREEGDIKFYFTSVKVNNNVRTIAIRNDPRKLDFMTEIKNLTLTRKVYVSYDPFLLNCSDSSLAATELGLFLGYLGLKTESVLAKPSKIINKEVVRCNDTVLSVIEILQDNETSLNINNKCIQLRVKDCNILKGVEKLIVELLAELVRKSKDKADAGVA